MQIQVNTDDNVNGGTSLTSHVEEVVRRVLGRFNDQVTRVEVHLSDINGPKPGENDKRCLMEARLAGRQPTAVSDLANSHHQAIDGAAHKLRRALDTVIGKDADRRRVVPDNIADTNDTGDTNDAT